MEIDPQIANIGKQPDNTAFEQQQHNAQQHIQAPVFHQAQHAAILPGDHLPRSGSLSSHAPQQQEQQSQYSAQLYHDPYEASQQSYAPLPQTPQMGNNNGLNSQTPSGANGATQKRTPASGGTPHDSDSKRPRACEACRGLKVKCEFEPTDPNGPCKRCTKAHRNCTITAPSRKRQKKTDSRVAELEKKIDALTQTLQATRSESQGGEIDVNAQGTERRESQAQSYPYEQLVSIAYGPQYSGRAEAGNEVPLVPSTYGQAMKPNMDVSSQSAWPQDFQQYPRMPELGRGQSGLAQAPIDGQGNVAVGQPPMVMAGQKRKHSKAEISAQAPGVPKQPHDNSVGRPSSKHSMTNEYADVIDRGLIKSDLASVLFDRYTHQMAPTMPAVIFPSGTTAADVRKSKPILFLAILAAGAMTDHPDLATLFTKEVMQVYADRVICRGEKSLELIQALLVSTLWYWPPEHFEEVKFYQLIHTAAVMGIDIGIHKQNKPAKTSSVASAASTGKSVAGMWNWRKQAFPDASSIEARRTWLGCYFICSNASTGLRRPTLIHWSPYIAESIGVLETSPLAVPSDKIIAQWAKSQRIMETIMPHFRMDEDNSNITLADQNIQAALAGYEQELDVWRDQVPAGCRSPLLKMSGHIVNLFMHEIALNVDSATAHQSQPSEQQMETPPLPGAQITALASCLESIDEIFSTFLSLDVDIIRVLPVMHFVRVAYAVAILMKLYFAATSPGNPLAAIVDKDNMKVEQYLDALLEKFKEIAKDEKSRPGSKFLMVLFMLRNCFYRGQKSKNGSALPSAQQTRPGSAQAAEAPAVQQSPAQQQQQQPQQMSSSYGQGSTPLDLLSQVATGSSAPRPHSAGKFDTRQPYSPMAQGPWAPWDTPNTPHISTMQQQQQQQQQQGFNIDPSLAGAQPQLGYDVNAAMEGGFDSIGMLGEGDLSQYFGDDAYQAFFKAMMEGAGTGGMGFDEYPMSIM